MILVTKKHPSGYAERVKRTRDSIETVDRARRAAGCAWIARLRTRVHELDDAAVDFRALTVRRRHGRGAHSFRSITRRRTAKS